MKQTSTKKDEPSSKTIDSHDEFQRALLRKQASIATDPYPTLEVSEALFGALAEGQPISSLTYGKPGVRVFKVGTTDDVLDYEDVSADVFRERELKKINEKARK